MKNKSGKEVKIIEDENEPSEEIIDEKTGKRKPRKKKIVNENGDIEELQEIEEDIPSEIDEETGKKKPKIRKYINNKSEIYEMDEPPKEEEKVKPKGKEKKPKKMKTPDGKTVHIVDDEEES